MSAVWFPARRLSPAVASQLAVVAGACCLVALALGRVHLRVQTTMVGYEIGRLKNDEAKLLEERSYLRMQLAKLTTKKHLELMTETGGDAEPAQRTFAQK
jgi:hypothetical protein